MVMILVLSPKFLRELSMQRVIEVQVYLPWRAPWSVGKVEEVLNAWDFIMTKAKTKAVIAVRKAVVPTAIDMNRSRRVTSVFDCQACIGWDRSCSLISSLSPNFPNQPVFFSVTVAELLLVSALLPFLISSISTKKCPFTHRLPKLISDCGLRMLIIFQSYFAL